VRGADNLATFMCPLSRNSGSLSLLDPHGFVHACTGTVLRLTTRTNSVVLRYAVTCLIRPALRVVSTLLTRVHCDCERECDRAPIKTGSTLARVSSLLVRHTRFFGFTVQWIDVQNMAYGILQCVIVVKVNSKNNRYWCSRNIIAFHEVSFT
jgi:hypothetical protein